MCSIQRQSDKALKKMEAKDKRRGKGGDPDIDWLVNQADALHILAGGPPSILKRVHFRPPPVPSAAPPKVDRDCEPLGSPLECKRVCSTYGNQGSGRQWPGDVGA